MPPHPPAPCPHKAESRRHRPYGRGAPEFNRYKLRKLSTLNIDWPIKQERLYPRAQPLIVEIGFGNGDFLIHLAQTQPDCNILGFEVSSQSMDKAEAKIDKLGLTNARAIHSRAETALNCLLPPETAQAFHINYPDPWFKKKHRRRRLIQRDTVNLLTSRLAAGGRLLLATDIIEYAEMAHEILSRTPGLTNQLASPWTQQLEGRFRTKYELKGYREGRRGHFFVYRRNDHPVVHPPVVKELDMPHLFLRSPLSAAEIVARFQAGRRRFDGIHIAILRAYADPGRNSAVFEVLVEEPTIEQHTMIMLSPRAGAGEYIVKMTSLGQARPTLGMHRAVAAVGEWVAGLDAGGMVLERKLRD
ncbi:MAG: tRNA (guanosine(46)-N7)-methyltransferase TrmB [Chloroflexota bacterium]|nr:tRNA (guanosine(46)-N7)-methyltransferase TrmB [Chloroflexota bacterium]MDE2945968.1 tRNA (guanosine(46)-N7)-methyltransferase TrmB [Chloroflexota bacterium]